MLAHSRTDVDELNTLARAVMQAEDRLGEEHLTAAGYEFRAGDRLWVMHSIATWSSGRVIFRAWPRAQWRA